MINLRLCRLLLRGDFRINFLGSLSQLFDLLLNLIDFLCQQVVQSINLKQPNIGIGMAEMAHLCCFGFPVPGRGFRLQSSERGELLP